MFEQLLDLVKKNAQDLVVNNTQIPNHQNDAVIAETTNVIKNVLSNAVRSGNLQDVMGMFGNSQNLANNPLVATIVSQLITNLSTKFGINAATAQSVAGNLIPQILSQFTNKTNDPNNSSFNINDIMGQLSGGKTSGIDFSSVVSQMQSGKGFNIAGLAGQLLGQKKSSGFGDILGGFLGK